MDVGSFGKKSYRSKSANSIIFVRYQNTSIQAIFIRLFLSRIYFFYYKDVVSDDVITDIVYHHSLLVVLSHFSGTNSFCFSKSFKNDLSTFKIFFIFHNSNIYMFYGFRTLWFMYFNYIYNKELLSQLCNFFNFFC